MSSRKWNQAKNSESAIKQARADFFLFILNKHQTYLTESLIKIELNFCKNVLHAISINP